jgi:predicted Rossmann-fold nucleotide-binding protein
MRGGWGTLDEIMEVVAWNQLSIHDRGTVLLSVEGLYTKLIEWANEDAVKAGFIKVENAKTAEEAILTLKNYKLSSQRHSLDWGSFP